jgi:hypothetical protein
LAVATMLQFQFHVHFLSFLFESFFRGHQLPIPNKTVSREGKKTWRNTGRKLTFKRIRSLTEECSDLTMRPARFSRCVTRSETVFIRPFLEMEDKINGRSRTEKGKYKPGDRLRSEILRGLALQIWVNRVVMIRARNGETKKLKQN